LRLFSELERRLVSTLDSRLPTGLRLHYYNYTKTFTSGELQVECGILNSIGRGIFIGIQGGVTDLIKSVTCQVLAGRPSHMVGRPPSLASTDFQLWISCYRLLESVPTKPTCERLQSGAGGPAPGPTGQWPLYTAFSCQVHSHGDTYFGGIPIFLVIS
jgi:hypothetical protein